MALSALYSVGASALGSVLGKSLAGSTPTLPYASNAAGGFQSGAQAGTNLYNLGAGQTQAFQNFAPTAANTVNQDISLLQQNPYTDSESAGQLANATSEVNADYAGAGANLAQSLQQRGLGGDGGPQASNTSLSGGLNALSLGRAQTLGSAQNQIAQNAILQRYQNLAQAAQLGQQYSGQLYGQGVGATQSGGELSDQAGQGYLQLGNAQQVATQNYADEAGSVGTGIGSLLGNAIGGFKLPQANSASTPVAATGSGGIPQIPYSPNSLLPNPLDSPVYNSALNNPNGFMPVANSPFQQAPIAGF